MKYNAVIMLKEILKILVSKYLYDDVKEWIYKSPFCKESERERERERCGHNDRERLRERERTDRIAAVVQRQSPPFLRAGLRLHVVNQSVPGMRLCKRHAERIERAS